MAKLCARACMQCLSWCMMLKLICLTLFFVCILASFFIVLSSCPYRPSSSPLASIFLSPLFSWCHHIPFLLTPPFLIVLLPPAPTCFWSCWSLQAWPLYHPNAACLCVQKCVLVHTCTRASTVCVCTISPRLSKCVLQSQREKTVNLLSGFIHLTQDTDSAWLHSSDLGRKGSQNQPSRGQTHRPLRLDQLLFWLSYSATSKSTNAFFFLFFFFRLCVCVSVCMQDCLLVDNGLCLCVCLSILSFVCVRKV